MIVNVMSKTKDKQTLTSIAICDDGGSIVTTETRDYANLPEGKYWGYINVIRRTFRLLDKLVEDRTIPEDTKVRFVIPSKVVYLWFSKGKAVEPYRYAFDDVLTYASRCLCDIELVCDVTSFNRAKKYCDAKYLYTEKYQNMFEAYADA